MVAVQVKSMKTHRRVLIVNSKREELITDGFVWFVVYLGKLERALQGAQDIS